MCAPAGVLIIATVLKSNGEVGVSSVVAFSPEKTMLLELVRLVGG